jgi:hypothetical protein
VLTIQDLEQFAKISEEVSNEWRHESVLEQICKTAVEMFGADHSGLVLFEDGSEIGVVRAEYPIGFGWVNALVDTRGVPAEQALLRQGAEN